MLTITFPAGKFKLLNIAKNGDFVAPKQKESAASIAKKDFQREIIDFLRKKSDNLLYTGEVSQAELLRSLSREIEKL